MQSLTAALLFLALAVQSYPPPWPRPNATKLLETDRIAVWDVVWPKGEATPLHRHIYDQVGTYYQSGGRVVTAPDGTKRSSVTPFGNLSTTKRGTLHIEEGATDQPLRAVFIEMKKDAPSGETDDAADVAPAFPRDGAKQLLDDQRVTVWDYSWTMGATEVARRYTRDAVVVWMGSGKLRWASPGGTPAVLETVPGKIRYTPRGTVLTEAAVEGTPRAFVFEFK